MSHLCFDILFWKMQISVRHMQIEITDCWNSTCEKNLTEDALLKVATTPADHETIFGKSTYNYNHGVSAFSAVVAGSQQDTAPPYQMQSSHNN